MSDAVTPAAVSNQYAELLPARTVLSLFTLDAAVGTDGANGSNSTGTPKINVLDIPVGLPQFGK